LLQGNLTALVGAAMFCTIAAALDAHVTEARRKGWCLPAQVVAGAQPAMHLPSTNTQVCSAHTCLVAPAAPKAALSCCLLCAIKQVSTICTQTCSACV
jgi:hypothetical protein